MRYRIGDEMTPLLRVRIVHYPMPAVLIIDVSPLPDNHPLGLAIEKFLRGLNVPMPGSSTLMVRVPEELWVRQEYADARRLIEWYREHQHTLSPAVPEGWLLTT